MRKHNHALIAWQCRVCHWLTISDSREQHDLDKCRCGEAWLDLEDSYARFNENYMPLLKNNLDGKGWKQIRKKAKKQEVNE